MEKIKAAILGPGNIGSDLMYKIMRSRHLQVAMMAGIVDSPGIQRAKSMGIPTTTDGIGPILDDPQIRIVFDSTGVRSHLVHAPLLERPGKWP